MENNNSLSSLSFEKYNTIDDTIDNTIDDTNNTELNNIVSDSDSNSDSDSDINNEINQNELKEGLKNCNAENYYTKNCNKFILKKELLERNYLDEHKYENEYLYPNLNDKLFNIKIAQKKEFNDTQYDGPNFEKSIKEQSEILANAPYELQPHQAFVKNFMSFQTPYSSLLLYHGLGSGKTCSAIGVTEEMRDYMKQMGINKRIIIVASENVQNNFKMQLFDERKLKEINGIWSTSGCIGNKMLKEINPMNMPITREKIITQIKSLINTYYIFLGYVQFANYIIKTMNYEEEIKKKTDGKVELNSRIIRRLQNEFNNRLIVIDEVHNIRKTEDNENKKVAINLEFLVKSVQNMRLLFLSATPMYNNYKEIIWLLNVMNMNDKRGKIDVKDVFYKNGEFKKNGKELLIRKATGYISFVRGENPYVFPYRIYPNEFAPECTFPEIKYPSYQMNLKKIGYEDKKRILKLFITKIGGCNNCGNCQYCCYRYIIHTLRNKKFSIITKHGVIRDMPSFENMESFGYTLLQTPIESLIISYPIIGLKDALNEIPENVFSEDISPSFDTLSNFKEDKNDEIYNDFPEPISGKEEPKYIIKSPFSVRKDTLENNEEIPVVEKIYSHDEDIIVNKKTRKLRKCKYGERLDNGKCPPKNNENPDSIVDKPNVIVEYQNVEKIYSHDEDIIVNKKTRKLRKCKYGERLDNGKCPPKNNENPDSIVDKPNIIVDKPKIIVDKPKIIDDEDAEILVKERKQRKCKYGERLDNGKCPPKPKKGGSYSSYIDPHQLTGKIGLERMMNFKDSKSPPFKGDYEYKPLTLKNYGKIFSETNIQNYSSKIKTILNCIYDSNKNFVSEGIILIYSQYIDSALIPMALALEEMGFSRYSETGKSLFKEKPSELVDVRTMKEPNNKKDFKPARYSMITGDTRLSPNNEYEVKALTNDDNKNGEKVKIILISRAGSEGIDFKFIRQVHILDPWYNMNRIEQIIGRAVRNFSHILLPFEKRNVQIFMHGTILNDNKEESADLYVYRVAEFKAIQIGKVTRVLKETAVDCLINYEQTKFTQEIMNKNSKEKIKQQLSTGLILQNFKVGDAPFSPACDYMINCNYNCTPDENIDKLKLNEDTYDENFIIINSEKIMQKIKMLFKDGFFYKKDMLMRLIRTPKEYPYVQIYSALTQLIEDKNEFITDKYGRNGKLINIGDYYLFQPIELIDKNVSIFERSIPIEFKHNAIDFELNQNKSKNTDFEKLEEFKFQKGKIVFDKIKTNYNITMDYLNEPKVERADDNWFKHAGIVMKKMKDEYPDSVKYLNLFLVSHIIELLLFEDKIQLMNYLYNLKSITPDTLEKYAKEYFLLNTITTQKFITFITFNLDKRMVMILNNTNIWVEALPEEQKEIAFSKETKDFLKFNSSDYNNIIGFIGYEKGNKNLSFKTKNMDSTRDTGAKCDQATKNKNLEKLNKIIGKEIYTIENTKVIKDKRGNVIKEAMSKIEICVLEEFILRYFNLISKNNKKWFLTPEMAIYHKLYKIFI